MVQNCWARETGLAQPSRPGPPAARLEHPPEAGRLRPPRFGVLHRTLLPQRTAGSDIATSLHVFHQIEVELHEADTVTAQDTALALLRHIASAFPDRGERALERIDVHDLPTLSNPPSNSTYDTWLERTIDPEIATWALHLPQNPLFVVNRGVGQTHLAETFEFLLPDGFGEVLSGGLRDRRTSQELWRRAGQDANPGPSVTSGLGIGLERLVAWLLECRDLDEVILAHCRV